MAQYHAYALPRPNPDDEPDSPEFPGCRPVRISREAITDYEGRFEYWSADTEVAMVCEPVTTYHEHPRQRLTGLLTTIAHVRGSPIETFGASDLLVRDDQGAHLRVMQADQTVYLHPRATRPWGPAIEVGVDTLPDVVLEVDNTTDVRRGKLALYEWWSFPEVWVEVPDAESPSRQPGLRPGLTIYLLGDDGYESVPVSRAFPGWTAAEIHQALNETELSAATTAALRRVARTLGDAEGTGPDDDLFLRAELREGHAKGRAEGLVEAQGAAVLQVFSSRGLPASAALPRRLAELEGISTAALVQAALECRGEADFLRRVAARA